MLCSLQLPSVWRAGRAGKFRCGRRGFPAANSEGHQMHLLIKPSKKGQTGNLGPMSPSGHTSHICRGPDVLGGLERAGSGGGSRPDRAAGRADACAHGAAQAGRSSMKCCYSSGVWLLVERRSPVLQPSSRRACSMKLSSTHTAAAWAPSSAASSGFAGNGRTAR
jgi:hypothetical protein